MNLINTAIVIFVGSAVLLSDPNVETAVAVGLITTLLSFPSSIISPSSRLLPAGAVCSWPLQGLTGFRDV